MVIFGTDLALEKYCSENKEQEEPPNKETIKSALKIPFPKQRAKKPPNKHLKTASTTSV